MLNLLSITAIPAIIPIILNSVFISLISSQISLFLLPHYFLYKTVPSFKIVHPIPYHIIYIYFLILYFFFVKLKDYSVKIQKYSTKFPFIFIWKRKTKRLLQHSLFLLYARFSFNHSVIASNLETSKRLSSHTFKLFKLFTISNSFDFILFASINFTVTRL